jgi:enoyl-CoA hydratase/carnithine racemase
VSLSDRISLTVDDDGLGRLTLARSDAGNAIDSEMVRALASAVDQVAEHDGLRALLISAEGRAFSVGGDLNHLHAELDRLPELLNEMVSFYHDALLRIATLPVPVVCAVQGAVGGGALGLLWVADVTIVASDAKLASGFLDLGLSGDGGSTWWLPRLIGLQRARQLLLSPGPITGATAAEWGLVTTAVPAEDVDAEAERAVRELVRRPAQAYAEVRALLAGTFERKLVEGLGAEREAIVRTAASEDAREGVTAFVERRPPSFGA